MPAMPARGQVKLILVRGCAFAILLVVAGVAYWGLDRIENANSRVSHTFDVLSRVNSAQGDVFAADASATNYVVTGDAAYLTAYDSATAQLRVDISALRSLTLDNETQQNQLNALDLTLASKLSFDTQIARMRAAGDVVGATTVLISDQNVATTTDVGARLTAMRDEEDRLLTIRKERADASGWSARLSIIVGVVIAMALAGVAAYSLNGQIQGRRRAEAEIDTFFDVSPDPFVMSTADLHAIRVNRAYTEAFGYTLEDLQTNPETSSTHPDDVERRKAAYAELASGTVSEISVPVRSLCKDGSVRWTTWHASMLPGSDLVFSVARDDTKQKHAEDELRTLEDSLEPAIAERIVAAEERARAAERAAREVIRGEEQLRIFVENTPTAVAMLDRDLRYLVASRKWSEDYDLGDETIVGRYHYDLFPDVDQRWKDIHKRCLQGATEQMEEDPFPRIDGKIDWVRWEIHPWLTADGDVGGIIMLFEQITERRRAAVEQRETTADLLRINSELEAFTYSVSHDLKEPLRTLEAFSQFLLKDYADKLDAEGKDYLSRLALASSRMKQLIDDLLTISRVGTRGEAAEPVDVKALIDEFVDGIRITVQERNATVIVEPNLPEVIADPRRIGQIFSNLISNGIKFNRGDNPTVEIGTRRGDNGEEVFFVRDNGIGIDQEYHEKIFGVFQRLHRREEFEGTGAGLAIVKRAVEALGGRIWVESTPGEGTTFLFTLPVSQDVVVMPAIQKAA